MYDKYYAYGFISGNLIKHDYRRYAILYLYLFEISDIPLLGSIFRFPSNPHTWEVKEIEVEPLEQNILKQITLILDRIENESK